MIASKQTFSQGAPRLQRPREGGRAIFPGGSAPPVRQGRGQSGFPRGLRASGTLGKGAEQNIRARLGLYFCYGAQDWTIRNISASPNF